MHKATIQLTLTNHPFSRHHHTKIWVTATRKGPRTEDEVETRLKGNSHQILLSEMSLPGIEVPIEKLLPKILGRLGKENPSKRRCKVAFVQRTAQVRCDVVESVSVRFLYATYN